MKVKTLSKGQCCMLDMPVAVGNLCGQLRLLRWWEDMACLLI